MEPQAARAMTDYQAGGKMKGKRGADHWRRQRIRPRGGHRHGQGGRRRGNPLSRVRPDAEATGDLVKREGVKFLALKGRFGARPGVARRSTRLSPTWASLDILRQTTPPSSTRNRASRRFRPRNWKKTFRTNVFSMFHLTKAALAHMKEGSAIVNSTSVTPIAARAA